MLKPFWVRYSYIVALLITDVPTFVAPSAGRRRGWARGGGARGAVAPPRGGCCSARAGLGTLMSHLRHTDIHGSKP